MEALSLTSEIVSEPSCSLALTDDSLPDDTHTLLLSAPESNVHAQPLTAPLASPGAGLAAGLQIPAPSPVTAPPRGRGTTTGTWCPGFVRALGSPTVDKEMRSYEVRASPRRAQGLQL